MAEGLWKFAGTNYTIPDLGITEKFTNWQANPAVQPTQAAEVQGANTYTEPNQYDSLDQFSGAYSSTGTGSSGTQYYNTPSNPVPTQQTQQPSAPSGGSPSRWDELMSKDKAGTLTQQEIDELAALRDQQGPDTNELYNNINTGWDSLMGQYNDILGNLLPQWQQSQTQFANQTYDTQSGNLGIQRDASIRDIEQQGKKNLTSLGEDVASAFQAGSQYLGARGAGSGSAPKMYSYAIQKQANKARGQMTSEMNQRMNQVKDMYNMGINNLEQQKNQRIAEVADWFNAKQMEIKQQMGQADVGRSQDLQNLAMTLYNQGIAEVERIKQEDANRRAALDSWAMSSSESIQQLASNLSQVSQLPAYQGFSAGTPQYTPEGGLNIPMGYGGSAEEDKGLFGNT